MKKTYFIVLGIEIFGIDPKNPVRRDALFNLLLQIQENSDIYAEDEINRIPLDEILLALKANHRRLGLFSDRVLDKILAEGTIKTLQTVEVSQKNACGQLISTLEGGLELYLYQKPF